MKLLLSVIALFACVGFARAQCGTTECTYYGRLPDREYRKLLEKRAFIFEGTIVAESEPVHPPKGFPYRILTIRVEQSLKGDLTGEVKVNYSYYDEDCLLLGEKGRRMFYLDPSFKAGDLMSTGQCSNGSMDDARTRRMLRDVKCRN